MLPDDPETITGLYIYITAGVSILAGPTTITVLKLDSPK
jgi:hypothetical protein